MTEAIKVGADASELVSRHTCVRFSVKNGEIVYRQRIRHSPKTLFNVLPKFISAPSIPSHETSQCGFLNGTSALSRDISVKLVCDLSGIPDSCHDTYPFKFFPDNYCNSSTMPNRQPLAFDATSSLSLWRCHSFPHQVVPSNCESMCSISQRT